MSLELLLDQFDHVIQTAADVDKLRGKILQLAVQGRLIPQDTNDEPTSLLLERNIDIANELTAKGAMRKQTPLPSVPFEEVPYTLPNDWIWCRLGVITNYGISDRTEASRVEPGTWLLDLADIESGTSRIIYKRRFGDETFASTKNVFQKGDVLYGKLRPYLDKVVVADEPGVCTTEMIPIRGYVDIDPHYLRLCLKRPDFIAYANSKTYGMNLPRLGTEDARKALIPLAPYQEQKRIVAKVDELFQQTQQLAQRLQSADHRRRHFHTAVLHHLTTAPTPAAATAAWNHLAPHFDQLYTNPDAITELKQAILHLAVSGRLVPQDPNDEPAAVLLKRIAAEKTEPVKTVKVGGTSGQTSLVTDKLPFEVPDNWLWVTLNDVCQHITDGDHQPPPKVDDGIPFLVISNISSGSLDFSNTRYVPESYYENLQEIRKPKKGDVIYSVTGSWGIPVLVDTDQKFVFQRHIALLRPSCGINARYLRFLLASTLVKEQGEMGATGIAQKTLSLTALRNILIPLPPLREQVRIVNAIDELLQYCDTLSSAVSSAETARQRLLNTLLIT